MSNKALTWAFEAAIDNVGAKFLLVALADHGTDHAGEDWTCFPAIERLAEFTSQGVRTVERHLHWLISQCWISKTERTDRRRGDARFVYTIHRSRAGLGHQNPDQLVILRASLDAKLACEQVLRPPAKLAGKTPATARQKRHDHPPKTTRPPAKLAEPPTPPYIAEPLLNPHVTNARAGEGLFEDGLAAYPKTGAAITNEIEAREAWRLASKEVAEPVLLACIRAFAADPMLKRRDYGAPSLQKFLRERRYRRWLDVANAVRDAAPSSTVFGGPPEVRNAIAEARGEAFVGSYLDRAQWRSSDRVVVARTGVAFDQLRKCNSVFERFGVHLECSRANSTPASELA